MTASSEAMGSQTSQAAMAAASALASAPMVASSSEMAMETPSSMMATSSSEMMETPASVMSSEAMPSAAQTGKIPAGALTGDVAIAAAGSATEGYGYVGVWAKDAATCAMIGDPGTSGFAIITTATFRDGATAEFGAFSAMGADNKLTAEAGDRNITLELTGPDALTVDGTPMVRCTP